MDKATHGRREDATVEPKSDLRVKCQSTTPLMLLLISSTSTTEGCRLARNQSLWFMVIWVAKESEPSIESEDQEDYGEPETSTYTSESEDSGGSNDFPPPPSARKYGTAAKISMHNTSAKSKDTRRAHPTQVQKRSTKAKTTEGTSRSRKGSQQERVTVSDQDSESDDDERKTPSIEEVKGISKAAKVQVTKDASKLKSQPMEKRAAKKNVESQGKNHQNGLPSQVVKEKKPKTTRVETAKDAQTDRKCREERAAEANFESSQTHAERRGQANVLWNIMQ
ncbi:uncharacterized protein N7458_009251 [Penicillium daleae]|uniref:Uncharacterized protein n=1 Tax=Penicillium daleae TaxID=63821 RepID=A0AAD6FXV9_9EURO|nr:uncharacterized protein N7458_009251 [Penicillium daleae]KAJ5438253.1 hypothetical protein N7458_009251 [Penicillium daleae]